MDELEEWGVLAVPESLGVTVEFVSPSMLVPKTDPGEFRLVTDFASLNVYLKRMPNTSATIAQAKSKIARARYVIHLDFSNFFYQNGMQKVDVQYLGTVHPFKGLRVYTCDPQGLKGASERSYEKLVRIYGDMIQDDKLAQMADGIHVLGDSIQQLALNYIEVLNRAEYSGFTFKPKKVIVCPRNINLFGWDLRGRTWYPTSHTISALANASKPVTIKQLRSFLGAFKQLSPTLPNYATTIHKLDQLVGGRKSADRIQWNEELEECFNKAKELAANPIGIVEPRPDDTLHTFSDYSQENRAVGGRLIILRPNEKGGKDEFVGGFFSTILSRHKKPWIPCEGESAAIRLVLEHFQHFIRESKNTTIHHTDSQPCVLAWKKGQRGAFSSSSRVSSFLVGLSALPVEIRYKPGNLMHTSDYASRHPSPCQTRRCQICSFVGDWESIGDNAATIRSISIEDVKSGKTIMPLIQRKTWLNIQKGDALHNKLTHLIETQQLPETKKTKGEHTKLKLLHNQYTQGKLFIAEDGLLMLRTPNGHFSEAVISVPPSIFPGLLNALHVRLDHPSKGQLSNLVARYFYTPGWRTYVDEISDNCHQCMALKQLPKVLLENTFSQPAHVAAEFSADVIERNSQKILIVKEKLSQYLRGQLIEDQKADTLREALLYLILDLVSDEGATIRVDGATSFQALERESHMKGSTLNKLGIKIVVGRLVNKNKNPSAENSIKEVQKEILRLKNEPGPISKIDLSLVLRNINSRIRHHGFSSKEILFRRNHLTNQQINVDDENIGSLIMDNKTKSKENSRKFKLKSHKPSPAQQFDIGNLVYIRNSNDKINPRDLYMVENIERTDKALTYLIRKVQNSLRPRLYRVLEEELILAPQHSTAEKEVNLSLNRSPKNPGDINSFENINHIDHQQMGTENFRPKRKAALKARNAWKPVINSIQKIKPKLHGWNTDDQDSDSDDCLPIIQIKQDSIPSCSDVSSCTSSTDTTENDQKMIESNSENDLDTSPPDLSNDFSPEQFSPTSEQNSLEEIIQPMQLYSPAEDENHQSSQYNVFCSTPMIPDRRQRRMAVSDIPIDRSNAFRNATEFLNEAVINSSEGSDFEANQQLEKSIKSVSNNLLNLLDSSPRNRRCPVPDSVMEVDLNQVNNLSEVLPLSSLHVDTEYDAHTNVIELNHLGLPQVLPRSRRSVSRPSNYAVFHRSGKRS